MCFSNKLRRWCILCFMIVSHGRLHAIAEPAIAPNADSLAAWNYKLSADDEALLDAIQRGCFQYFWKEVGRPAMLAKDKTSDTICSVAAVGFQLSSVPIGVE